jgi:hypothetical protein
VNHEPVEVVFRFSRPHTARMLFVRGLVRNAGHSVSEKCSAQNLRCLQAHLHYVPVALAAR